MTALVGLFRRYRELLIVGVLLVYPFLSFLSHGSAARAPNLLDRAVVGLTTPVQKVLCWVIDGGISGVKRYVALRGVEHDNEVLREENETLRGQVVSLAEAQAENARLKGLLDYGTGLSGTKVAARIVGVNPVSTLLSVRIDRGMRAGVEKGMAVVTPEGAVGQVMRAGGSWADVLLLTDPNSRIGVRSERSRTRAIAAGEGAHQSLRLDDAVRTEDLKDGDVVVTSGTDGVFPPGIKVGTLSEVQRGVYGMFQTARIQPAVDTTRLEEVLVLPAQPVIHPIAEDTK